MNKRGFEETRSTQRRIKMNYMLQYNFKDGKVTKYKNKCRKKRNIDRGNEYKHEE